MRFSSITTLAIVAVLAATLATGCGKSASSPPANAAIDTALTGDSAPRGPMQMDEPGGNTGVSLRFLDFDGIEKLIASKRGRVVVLDAWSTSCEPCVREFPHFVALSKTYGPQQVACISLSFDYEGIGQPEGQRQQVLDFLRKQRAAFDNVLSSDESDVLYRKFKLASVPAVFVYDRRGRLRKRFDNEQAKTASEAFTYEDVDRLVAQLIAEGEPAGQTAN